MKLINIKNLSKTYHTIEKEINTIDNISLDVDEGEILSIIGPSGCGKSTLLNILTNLEEPSLGTITTSKDLIIGYMMQSDGLIPWLTVKDNALLGLKLKGKLNEETMAYTLNLIDKYGLSEFLMSYPKSLSGGMRQRVA